MRKYTIIQIKESQLEDLIRQAPDLIEQGLRFVDHQVATERGPLDVLLVDDAGALVVAELKVESDDGILEQAIDYYDYARRNIEALGRAYSSSGVDPQKDPRLFLIAPEFSENLINRLRWLRIPVVPISFQILQFNDDPNTHIPVYRQLTLPAVPEPLYVQSIDQHYDYITDLSIREMAKQLVSAIQSWDSARIQVDNTTDALSIKHYGRVLAYLYPRRKFFHVGYYSADRTWCQQQVNGEEDLQAVVDNLKTVFDELTGSRPRGAE